MDEIGRSREGAIKAHRDVLTTLHELTDEQARKSSLLPGWTVGHVLTHIARNGEGHLRMFEGALRDEVAVMYPGGEQQRSRDIEAGAGRPAAELIRDVADTASALEAVWASLPSEAWARRGQTLAGDPTMTDLLFIRRREVCVHHADLGLGYSWADWDEEYVRLELARMTMLWASRKPMGLTELPREALAVPANRRVAWLLGRAEIDGLPEAGLIL